MRRLPVTALDLKNNRLIVKTIKRGKIVSITLHSELRAALDTHLAYRNRAQMAAEWVFTTDAGKPNESLDAELRRVFKRVGVVGGRAHRFRDTFAVRLLATGASLYDVAKLMGINMATAELHYSPYVKELQERGARLVAGLSVPTFAADSPKNSHPPSDEKVLHFCAPGAETSNSGEAQANDVQKNQRRKNTQS